MFIDPKSRPDPEKINLIPSNGDRELGAAIINSDLAKQALRRRDPESQSQMANGLAAAINPDRCKSGNVALEIEIAALPALWSVSDDSVAQEKVNSVLRYAARRSQVGTAFWVPSLVLVSVTLTGPQAKEAEFIARQSNPAFAERFLGKPYNPPADILVPNFSELVPPQSPAQGDFDVVATSLLRAVLRAKDDPGERSHLIARSQLFRLLESSSALEHSAALALLAVANLTEQQSPLALNSFRRLFITLATNLPNVPQWALCILDSEIVSLSTSHEAAQLAQNTHAVRREAVDLILERVAASGTEVATTASRELARRALEVVIQRRVVAKEKLAGRGALGETEHSYIAKTLRKIVQNLGPASSNEVDELTRLALNAEPSAHFRVRWLKTITLEDRIQCSAAMKQECGKRLLDELLDLCSSTSAADVAIKNYNLGTHAPLHERLTKVDLANTVNDCLEVLKSLKNGTTKHHWFWNKEVEDWRKNTFAGELARFKSFRATRLIAHQLGELIKTFNPVAR